MMMIGKKGRILGIDFGKRRIGIAATDPEQIIVSGLGTIERNNFRTWLDQYISTEKVMKIVFGKPLHPDGTPTSLWPDIEKEISFIQRRYPDIAIDYEDESFTSAEAKSIIYRSGLRKKKRRDKKYIDKVSAVLILQRYLRHI